MKKIRILLIQDNRLLREGLTAMLKEQPDMAVVAASGSSIVVAKGKKLKPDVVLVDVGVRSHNGLRLIELRVLSSTRQSPVSKNCKGSDSETESATTEHGTTVIMLISTRRSTCENYASE